MTASLVRPDTTNRVIVIVHFDGHDEMHGGFVTPAAADSWADERFGRDRSCLSWDVYGPAAGVAA